MWALLVPGMFHTTDTEENVLLSLVILSRAVSGRSGALGGPISSYYKGAHIQNDLLYLLQRE